MVISQELVANLYLATMGRTMASAGLDYWTNTGAYDGQNGHPSGTDLTTMEELSASFAAQPEYAALYPAGTTDTVFINQIFQNLFQRDAASTYWQDEIAAGRTTRAEAVMSIISGAKGDDATILANRAAVAIDMADNHVLTTEVAKSQTVIDALKAITADPASKDTASTAIVAEIDAHTAKTFTLTTGVDAGSDFLGGSGADTYTSELLTLNDGDSLDGGDGIDTLNVETSSDITDKVAVTNIENINISSLGAIAVDMKSMTGVTELSTINSTGKITVTNANSADMKIGLKGSNTNSVDVSYSTDVLKGTADKLTVDLMGATSASVVVDDGFESVEINTTAKSDISTLTAPNAKTLTLSGTGALTIANGAIDSFETYNITDTAAVSLGSVATVKSLNATANTGGIITAHTITTEGLTKGMSSAALVMDRDGSAILLGEGSDNINVSATNLATTASGTIKLGAGDDKVNYSASGSGKVFIFGEDGNDTIYLGADLGSSDLVDGGAGTDTLSLGAGTYSAVVKGIETLNINGAVTASFTSTDTAMTITDSGASAVTVSNLLNGSAYKATVAKTGNLALGFKSAEAATINIDLQKGTTGDIATTNAKDVTLTLGAASTLDTGIALDGIGKTLTINATGAVNTKAISGSSEVLSTLKVTGDKAVTVGNITNDKKIATVDVSSSGGNVSVGTIGDIGNTATDKNIDKISVVSDTGTADIGAIDISGTTSTATGSLKELTVKGKGNVNASGAATIVADTVGIITITSTSGTAKLGTVEVGKDTTDTTDGTVTAINVTASGNSEIGNLTIDKVDAITLTSSTGTATLGTIKDAQGNGLATVGTLDVTAKAKADVGAITADALGNTNITSTGADVALAAITVTNASNDSVTGDLTVKANTNIVDAAKIAVEKSGDMSFTATTGKIDLAGIDIADSNGTTVTLDAKTTIDSSALIQNTAGDLTVVAKGDANLGATAFTVKAASTANTDIDLSVDASALKGTFGVTGTHATVTNDGTDADSSTLVKIGSGDSFVDILAKGGTVKVYGNDGADTIDLSGTDNAYTTATIYGEKGNDEIILGSGVNNVNGGAGADKITLFGETIDVAKLDQINGYEFNTADEAISDGGTGAVWDDAVTGWTITNGVATKSGATVNDFYTDFVDVTGTANEIAAFVDGGNTYLFGEGAATGDADNVAAVLIGVEAEAIATAAAADTVLIV